MPKFSINVEKALVAAEKFAAETGGIVGTEHILLGLYAVKDGIASVLMQKFGVTENMILQHLEREGRRDGGDGVCRRRGNGQGIRGHRASASGHFEQHEKPCGRIPYGSGRGRQGACGGNVAGRLQT